MTVDRNRAASGDALAPFETAEAAEAFCAELYQTVERLQKVFEEETAHLKAMNIAEAEALQREKAALAGSYVRKVNTFKVQAPAIRALVPEAVPFLAEANRKMRESLLANERTLETLRSVSASLVRKTAERMAEKSAGPTTYSRGGAAAPKSGAAAVAVNRRA